MKRLLIVMSMAVGVSAASVASAHDATKVIYDLSELQGHALTAPAPHTSNPPLSMRLGSLPMARTSAPNLDGDGEDDNLVVRGHSGGPSPAGRINPSPGGSTAGSRGTGGSPTPEPGTMLLLGTGLAAGLRSLRRRTPA